jgi:hypothetical protein
LCAPLAASKRKGIWVGGPIPLGYASVGKNIVPEEAETVRTMFRLYLECGSVGALAEELGRRNIASKVRTFASGKSSLRGACPVRLPTLRIDDGSAGLLNTGDATHSPTHFQSAKK